MQIWIIYMPKNSLDLSGVILKIEEFNRSFYPNYTDAYKRAFPG